MSIETEENQGRTKRKGVRIPSCRATVMETKAVNTTGTMSGL